MSDGRLLSKGLKHLAMAQPAGSTRRMLFDYAAEVEKLEIRYEELVKRDDASSHMPDWNDDS